MRGTIFIDLDGVIISHNSNPCESGEDIELLNGSKEKIERWKKEGFILILCTSRNEKIIHGTINKLKSLGLEFDIVIYNLPPLPRHLINDSKLGKKRAFAYNITRNLGIKKLILKDK